MDSLATAATSVATFVVAGDCPIMGLGSFGTLAFWDQKRVRMDGAAHSKVHQPVNELSQSSLEGKGLVGVNRHTWMGPAGRRPWAWRWARATWRGSACPPGDVDFIQLSKIRGAANDDVETSRGRKSISERCGSIAAGA